MASTRPARLESDDKPPPFPASDHGSLQSATSGARTALVADPDAAILTHAAGALKSVGLPLTYLLGAAAVIVAAIAFNATAILLVLDKQKLEDFSIDQATCSGCSCWDGLSKAPYSKGRFKFVYHNLAWETTLLLAILVVHVLMLDRSVRTIASAILSGRPNWLAVVAFVASMPGVFYGAGVLSHYINDQDHRMVPTQLYFSITETICAACILRSTAAPGVCSAAEAQVESATRRLGVWLAWAMSLTHVVLAGLDQIIEDLFVRPEAVQPQAYSRALVFSITDCIVLAWASWELGMCLCRRQGVASPSWRAVAAWLVAVVAVCSWYRLALPLV